ncbi:MAG: Na+/H+ antiporter NhaC family protein, partial [Lachnospiraceae bacterium]
LTLLMVFLVIGLNLDFGLMKKHEDNAAKGDLFTSGAEEFKGMEEAEKNVNPNGKVIDLVLPVIVLIGSAVFGMIYTGILGGSTNIIDAFANCDAEISLIFATVVTVIFMAVLYLPRKIVTFKSFMDSLAEGAKLMLPAILILTFAWTLKGMGDNLGIAEFVNGTVGTNATASIFIPAIMFGIALFLAFSTGTSWGTFAILVPIVVSMFASSDEKMMVIAVSAVLAGAVCGDHVSPISDTTIMSSSGAQSNHINHVQTQMQYAMVVAVVCVIGYIIAALTKNWIITLALSAVLLVVALLLIKKYYDKKETA